MNIILSIVFGIVATILILCTIIELALAGGFSGLIIRQSFPWLISGWCIWLVGFYVCRKYSREENEDDIDI